MTVQFPPPGPLTVGGLLGRAFRLYAAHFGLFLLTAAIFFFPIRTVTVLLRDVSIIAALTPVLDIAATALASLVLTSQAIEALRSRPDTTGLGIRRGLRHFWSYVGMTIIGFTAIIGATLVTAIPFGIGMDALGDLFGETPDNALDWIRGEGALDTGLSPGTVALIIFGIGPLLILLSSPAVYLMARWFVALPALIVEGSGAFGSLRRSWELSRESFWRILGYMLILELPVRVLPLVIEHALEWSIEANPPAGAPPFLFHFISTPLRVSVAVLLYYDLRIRNDDPDQEQRAL